MEHSSDAWIFNHSRYHPEMVGYWDPELEYLAVIFGITWRSRDRGDSTEKNILPETHSRASSANTLPDWLAGCHPLDSTRLVPEHFDPDRFGPDHIACSCPPAARVEPKDRGQPGSPGQQIMGAPPQSLLALQFDVKRDESLKKAFIP